MNKYIKSQQIIESPDVFLATEGKRLEDRLKKISIGINEHEIIKRQTGKTIRDSVLGSIPLGQAVSAILNWNENIDADIENAKKNKLLELYFEKSDEHDQSIYQMKRLLSNPQGNTLFNKILQIIGDSPPDVELIKHLSSSLKYVADSDFVKLFETHKYSLSQIEKLTPQGLSILSDYSNWPKFDLKSYSANGGRITSDWLNDFVRIYAPMKGIKDPALSGRLLHSLNDLHSYRLVDAWLVTQRDSQAHLVLSGVGQSIASYLEA